MKVRILLTASLLGLGLSACTAAPAPPVVVSPPAFATPAPPLPPNVENVYGSQTANERGNLVKEIGQPAGIQSPDGSVMLDFALTGVREVTCPTARQGYPSENGRFLAVSIAANTHDDPENMLKSVSFSYSWEHVNPEAVSVQADTPAAGVCASDIADPTSTLRPNRKYTTEVVLDVPKGEGALVWTQGANVGWEWKL